MHKYIHQNEFNENRVIFFGTPSNAPRASVEGSKNTPKINADLAKGNDRPVLDAESLANRTEQRVAKASKKASKEATRTNTSPEYEEYLRRINVFKRQLSAVQDKINEGQGMRGDHERTIALYTRKLEELGINFVKRDDVLSFSIPDYEDFTKFAEKQKTSKEQPTAVATNVELE
jgi:hypothetical protein